MPYVVRDTDNKIIGLYTKKNAQAAEYKETDDPELTDFLVETGNENIAKELLANYDYSVLRVLEDLIFILIRDHLIQFEEFPESAKSKLLNREALRRLLDQVKHTEEMKALQQKIK